MVVSGQRYAPAALYPVVLNPRRVLMIKISCSGNNLVVTALPTSCLGPQTLHWLAWGPTAPWWNAMRLAVFAHCCVSRVNLFVSLRLRLGSLICVNEMRVTLSYVQFTIPCWVLGHCFSNRGPRRFRKKNTWKSCIKHLMKKENCKRISEEK
jgi:hypothetical protein